MRPSRRLTRFLLGTLLFVGGPLGTLGAQSGITARGMHVLDSR